MQTIPKQEYTAEFEEQAVKRVKEGRGVAAVAKEMGLVEQKRENDILRKATAYFARDAL